MLYTSPLLKISLLCSTLFFLCCFFCHYSLFAIKPLLLAGKIKYFIPSYYYVHMLQPCQLLHIEAGPHIGCINCFTTRNKVNTQLKYIELQGQLYIRGFTGFQKPVKFTDLGIISQYTLIKQSRFMDSTLIKQL